MSFHDRRRELEELFSTPPYSEMSEEQKLHSLEAAIAAVDRAETIRKKRDTCLGGTEEIPMSYVEALEWAKRAMDFDLRSFGQESKTTQDDQYVLALLLLKTGEFRAAGELFDRVYASWVERLGLDHRKTLLALQGRADVWAALGRRRKARRITELVLDRRMAAFGESDEETLASAHSLATLLARLGQKEKAIRIAEEVLTLRKEVLGENHPDTLASLRFEAELRLAHAAPEEAEEEFSALHDRCLDYLGNRHPETLAVLYDLARCQHRLRRHGIAALMFNNCHELRNDVLGNHPDTLRALRSEAGSWGRVGKQDAQWLCWEMLFLSLFDRFLSWLSWLVEKQNKKKPREKPVQPQRLAS